MLFQQHICNWRGDISGARPDVDTTTTPVVTQHCETLLIVPGKGTLEGVLLPKWEALGITGPGRTPLHELVPAHALAWFGREGFVCKPT